MEEGLIFIDKAQWLYDGDIFIIKQYIEKYEMQNTHFRDKIYFLKQINGFSDIEPMVTFAELYNNELLYMDNIPDKRDFTEFKTKIFVDQGRNDITDEIIERFGHIIWKS